jgi:hypothetical protein
MLLFSDKKSEEEKGAVEWILPQTKKFKALLKMQKKATHREVFGDFSEPGAFFSTFFLSSCIK